jgi:pimeloyl-ACP methyl ester carboxylesterase
MQTVQLAEIHTPKKFILNGIWYGPKRAQCVFIYVHGLGGNMLNSVARSLAPELTDQNCAYLSFNNRGYGTVSKAYKNKPKTKKGYESVLAGAAHEVFEECVDDIEGAVQYARAHGAKQVFLIGHSTGCQKSIYWAHKKGKGVDGIVLLAPVSDYPAMKKIAGAPALKRAGSAAQKLVAKKKKHALLPLSIWPELVDAQRFLSLYSGKGNEEIFTYWAPEQKPKTLRSIEIPILAIVAENDEYNDRPAGEIAAWLLEHLYTGEVMVVPKALHSFHGTFNVIGAAIDRFMKERYN